MAVYAYLFEARGIQRFLFSTGKLKDMVAGSDLIDYICSDNGYVDQVLSALDLKDDVEIPRKAGGVFYLVFKQKQHAERFQATWRFVSSQWFPSVETVDALSQAECIKDAISAGIGQLSKSRNNLKIELPNASPITERSPRTGLAAVKRDPIALGRKESIDVATAAIRQFERPPKGCLSLESRFYDQSKVDWPNNFESNAADNKKFPLGRRSLIGLVHADGNGLGEILRILNKACVNADDKTYVDLYQTFSAAVTNATIWASQQASEKILLEHAKSGVMPARPLVLGGDDLSMIIRADLAIPFTKAFLIAFKQSSEIEIAKLKQKFKKYNLHDNAEELPDYLTACAGIVFMKASQPFHSAYTLAEGLCTRAKNHSRGNQSLAAKTIPSSLAFYKLNDSLIEDIDVMHSKTQTAIHQKCSYALSMPAYFVDNCVSESQRAHLNDLIELNNLLKNSALNLTTLREMVTLIYENLDQAKQTYQRWGTFSNTKSEQRSSVAQKQDLDFVKFQELLEKIVGGLETNFPFHRVNQKQYQTAIGDLLALATISEEIYQKKEGLVS